MICEGEAPGAAAAATGAAIIVARVDLGGAASEAEIAVAAAIGVEVVSGAAEIAGHAGEP